MRIDVGTQTLSYEELPPSDLTNPKSLSNTPVLFLHGWGGSTLSLKPLAEFVSPWARRIILDLPGFGQSTNPDSSWGVGEYAEVIYNFLITFGYQKIIIIGHSFGATLALYLASKYPELVERVVVCAPSYLRAHKTTPQQGRTLSSLVKPLFDKLPLLKWGVYRVFFPNSDLLKFKHLESNFRKIIHQDTSDEMSKIKSSTLIIWGVEDRDTPLEDGKLLHTLIPHSRLEALPFETHNLPVKYPEKIYKIINSFLAP